MFAAARYVKDEIYGNRLVLFAPLYISNLCQNECSLLRLPRRATRTLTRRALTQEEIAGETRMLIEQGHKRLLLVAGESYPQERASTISSRPSRPFTRPGAGAGEIRRVNVNIAPLTVDQFKQLKAAGIGTYQLFQETYHRETYARGAHGRRQDAITTGA